MTTELISQLEALVDNFGARALTAVIQNGIVHSHQWASHSVEVHVREGALSLVVDDNNFEDQVEYYWSSQTVGDFYYGEDAATSLVRQMNHLYTKHLLPVGYNPTTVVELKRVDRERTKPLRVREREHIRDILIAGDPKGIRLMDMRKELFRLYPDETTIIGSTSTSNSPSSIEMLASGRISAYLQYTKQARKVSEPCEKHRWIWEPDPTVDHGVIPVDESTVQGKRTKERQRIRAIVKLAGADGLFTYEIVDNLLENYPDDTLAITQSSPNTRGLTDRQLTLARVSSHMGCQSFARSVPTDSNSRRWVWNQTPEEN